MRTIQEMLQDSDAAIFLALGHFWGVDIKKLSNDEIIEQLHQAMQDSTRAENIWETLEGGQRGAVQLLISTGQKMPTSKFEVAFGKIRKMGRGAIERDQPHLKPQSIAEALYYRGLIAETFESTSTGLSGVIYVPRDLVPVLPLHRTAYENLDDEIIDDDVPEMEALSESELISIRQADTSIVDDLTTLLAYLQIFSGRIEGESLATKDYASLSPYLLTPGESRLAFLLGIGVSADLITTTEGKAYPRRADARRWLDSARHHQVRQLAEGWRTSTIYRDLWHVSGLHPETSGWAYDPVVGRGAVMGFLSEFAPETDWFAIEEFIDTIKEVEPDFQRPGSDYDSWYIRNDEGEYLQGFTSWDAIEGALIEFYLMGPMHWLGLVDIAEDAARLTAYGRAFLELTDWPERADDLEKIVIESDGTLLASRRSSRFDRFQLARFTTWGQAGDPYVYKLDAQGIQRAGSQGITTQHINAFLNRHLDEQPIPPVIVKLLESWQGGASEGVTFERVMVLRTTSAETLDHIYDNPPTRRFLGARLGRTACIVLSDQWEALRDTLGEEGIEVEVIER